MKTIQDMLAIVIIAVAGFVTVEAFLAVWAVFPKEMHILFIFVVGVTLFVWALNHLLVERSK
jgi:uncharacterized membrane protein